MRAVVLREPGPVENLELAERPLPRPKPGWGRVRVEAFGLNRSELHTRIGLAEGMTFPRVPGIEAAGVVDAVAPGGTLRPGQQVASMAAVREALEPVVIDWVRPAATSARPKARSSRLASRG
ncbi:hypothetical protein GCM10022419_095920 [Nonomuraea rosea]|uniref:Alcohol dehydrogenase-like N-terminal domain-containing protein n=1 Tax=Nonomuraea rosea TaxID=638574 RepID=A0ABP6Z7H7_9ACTN